MIRSDKYNVVLSGNLLDGVDISEVKAGFSRKFKITREEVDRIFMGRAKVLKKNLDHKSAYYYKRVIRELGAEVDLQRVAPDVDSTLSHLSLVSSDLNTQVYAHSLPKGISYTCPRCGVRTNVAGPCLSCKNAYAFDEPISFARDKTLKEDRRPPAASRQTVPAAKFAALVSDSEPTSTLTFMVILSYCFYAFGIADLTLYVANIADLTGVIWSPYVAFAMGYICSLFGNNDA